MRIDVYLHKEGYFPSRQKARQEIEAGNISVNGRACEKVSREIRGDEKIEVLGSFCPYVSRGGLKLEHALRHFEIDVAKKAALDIGASTGGFTHCLLNKGVKSVTCVDVGTSQLAPIILHDLRVTSYEKTDIRSFAQGSKRTFDFICADVSFISLTHIFGSLRALAAEKCDIVCLVKPQFELERGALNKKGIVKSDWQRQQALDRVLESAAEHGFNIMGSCESPLQGGDGNKEFLAYLKRSDAL